MSGKKPRTFDVATEFPSGMAYYFQPATGDEVQVPHSLLLEQLADDGVIIDAGTVTKADDESIAFTTGQLVLALIVTASTNLTMSVGTSLGGTQVLDSEALTSGAPTVFVINKYFSGSGSLYFSLSAGTVTVHVKKI